MFFSFPQPSIFGRKISEAAVNLANVAFVEFGAVKEVPYANVYLSGHNRVLTVTGKEDVDRLRQAMAGEAPGCESKA